MADLKTQHLLTLAHLLSKGGKHNFITLTTSSLGKSIGRSQQAASLHLKELEEGGFIERIQSGRKQSIKITNKGFVELSTLHNLLSKLIAKSSNSLNNLSDIVRFFLFLEPTLRLPLCFFLFKSALLIVVSFYLVVPTTIRFQT